MLNLQRWQTIAVIAFTAFAVLFALPNVLPAVVLDHLPGWYQQSRINLGLDLRGGAHFLLEADLRSVLNERLTNLGDSVRGELRKQQVTFKDITTEPGRAVVVVLRDESQRAKAIEAIRNVDVAVLLTSPGKEYGPVTLFESFRVSQWAEAAAGGVIYLIILIVAVSVAKFAFKMKFSL